MRCSAVNTLAFPTFPKFEFENALNKRFRKSEVACLRFSVQYFMYCSKNLLVVNLRAR